MTEVAVSGSCVGGERRRESGERVLSEWTNMPLRMEGITGSDEEKGGNKGNGWSLDSSSGNNNNNHNRRGVYRNSRSVQK